MLRRTYRKSLFACSLCVAAAFGIMLAAPALGNYHLMKVREVYPGSAAAPDSDYLVLQMLIAGQSFVNGHEVIAYKGDGTVSGTVTMDANVNAGDSQSTILIAGSGYAAAFPGSPAADFTSADLSFSGFAGAVCFPDGLPADCVSWGTFSPLVGFPSVSSPNASAGGIGDAMALRRSIAAGCATLLESGDDTNSSAGDFSEVAPAPRSNASAPAESPCLPPPTPTPNTTISNGPQGPTADRTPTFRFRSSLAGSTFRCRLDRQPFRACASPKAFGRLGLGAHTFQVRAIKDGRLDPSPARRSIRIIRRR